MDGSGGWLARVARRFGELIGTDDASGERPEPRLNLPVDPPREPAADEQAIPPGVRVDANGRYLVGGFSFSSLAQALEYNTRRERSAAASAVPTPAVRPPARIVSRQTPCWVDTETELTAGGYPFRVAMVYAGTPARYDRRNDHSRIDPSLAVHLAGDPAGTTLDYWPSYAGLDPRARWTYLDWLSRGRSDPDIPIGYVFLYFYGLEQRLLFDNARDEAPAIFAEVRRLIAIYGENYAFWGYASRLLALSALYEDQDDAPPTSACAAHYDLELPLDVRVRLGQRLRDGEAFDADDALRWVLALPDTYLRTPGQRCFEEMRSLWTSRFAARHPDGLHVKRPQSFVRQEYRAASGTFTANLAVDELPDISGVSAPLPPLRAMLDGCMEDLSAYSRLLGREPDARGKLRADLLLPVDLRAGRASLDTCHAALTAFATGGLVSVSELLRTLDLEVDTDDGKLPAALARQLATALDALDHGCEPDRRYGPGTGLRMDMSICVFAAPGGGPVDHERPAYATARGMVEVAMLAATSDGEVVAAEMAVVEQRLRADFELSEHEVVRLLAYGVALAADPPKVRSALKKLAALPAKDRETLAASAIEAVLADGRLQPDEVRFLESLHTALELPAAALYSALHRGGEDGVSESPDTPVGSTLPTQREESGLTIDPARLERIRGETGKVAALLATIFVEEEAETPPPRPKPAPATTIFEGLDGPHSELLTRLLDAPLGRDAFETAATGLRLMPDGAIEAINEWGFDRFGDAVIEDDAHVRIVAEMIEQLQLLGADA